ncbi:MAG: HD domain-containing protein [Spirochaetia bacterium]|jgi:putative nucleotidyltransferase with HDIG domain|nr:HD domain-containing protein [Spirochaetia bacterium]
MDAIQKIDAIRNELKEGMITDVDTLMHTLRVEALAMALATNESDVDMTVLHASCLLHDIARGPIEKTGGSMGDHAKEGSKLAATYLKGKNWFSDKVSDRIALCIAQHSRNSGPKPDSIEAKLLFDADKLDFFDPFRLSRFCRRLGYDATAGVLSVRVYSGKGWMEQPLAGFIGFLRTKCRSIESCLFLENSRQEAIRRLPKALITLQQLEESCRYLDSDKVKSASD